MADGRKDTGWRGSADLWLDGAYGLLVEAGVEAVKVGPLADRLGLSRTSFYWHFADREALLAGLVARWQTRNTRALLDACARPSATAAEAMLALCDLWVDPRLFDSRLEFAIRTWALTDPGLAATLRAADSARIAALTALFVRHGTAAVEAGVRARTVYLTQVGYISMRTEETLAERLARIPSYVLIFTGQAPTAAEVAAFRARHSGQAKQ